MAVFVLTSTGHAPGVTSTCLGLAHAWAGPIVVADCDRLPSQSVLAGYLQGQDPARRGLSHALQAHRERRPLEPVIEKNLMPLVLSDDTRPARLFLPGFSHPGMVGLFSHAWPDLMGALASYPADVLIDAGHVGTDGLPKAMARLADAVVVVVRTSLVSLASLRLYLPILTETVPDGRLGLLLVGENQPYGRAEVEAQFGVPVWAQVTHDPDAAACYSEGVAPPRKFEESSYVKSLARAGRDLAAKVADRRQLVGVPR